MSAQADPSIPSTNRERRSPDRCESWNEPMNARELREWARAAPPGTLIPAERVAQALEGIEEAPVKPAGASDYVTTTDYARNRCGGAVTPKTVAKWCRKRKIHGAQQLPNGEWLVPVWADPPRRSNTNPAADRPRPAGRDGVIPLREVVRRTASQGRKR